MQVRKLPVRQGLAWFRDAVNLGARNPKAIFGASLLLIGVMYAIALVLVLAARAMTGEDAAMAGKTFLLGFVPLFVAMMVLLPILIGGLMHVIREVEGGRPAHATDLFAPFRSDRAKPLAALGLLQIAFAMLGGVVMLAIGGTDYWKDYLEAIRAAMGGTPPVVPHARHEALLAIVQLAYNYFTYAVMLFAVPLVLFSRVSLLEAVRGALRASVSNIGPNLLSAGLFALGAIVGLLATAVIALVVGWLGSLVHPLLGTLLAFMVGMAFATSLLVVLAGGAYFAWRDCFDGAAPPAFTGIEA